MITSSLDSFVLEYEEYTGKKSWVKLPHLKPALMYSKLRQKTRKSTKRKP